MIPYIRIQDIIDIIIITVVVYQLYRWFRNTRALQVVIGLAFMGILYLVTRAMGLFMTSWILQELGTVLFVLIIVIFQGEIRQALYRVSLLRHAIGRQVHDSSLDLREFAETVFAMASSRTGALIVLQRHESLDDHLQQGVAIDAVASAQLISTIFQDGTPLHDGALIIKGARILRASCHLPLAVQSELPAGCGTRHRAALGLSERTDAIVIVVSEEKGTVALALGQELSLLKSVDVLQERLSQLLVSQIEMTPRFLPQGIFKDIKAKALVFALVIASWLLLTTKQGEIITVTSQVRFRNLPEQFTLRKSVPDELDVQLKVFSSLIPSPKQLDVVAELDLANVHEGINQLALRNDDIKLPVGVKISAIKPNVIRVMIAKKASKQVPIRISTTGTLPSHLNLRKIRSEPAMVTVEGPDTVLSNLEYLMVEEVDLSGIHQSVSLDRAVLSPSLQVKIVKDAVVKVRLVVGK